MPDIKLLIEKPEKSMICGRIHHYGKYMLARETATKDNGKAF